jgi:hypothetical protein
VRVWDALTSVAGPQTRWLGMKDRNSGARFALRQQPLPGSAVVLRFRAGCARYDRCGCYRPKRPSMRPHASVVHASSRTSSAQLSAAVTVGKPIVLVRINKA